MNELFVPCLSYALLMTFTPGPNNVSSSALGLRVGYRKSLPYLLGITTGFMVIMLCGGLLTDFLTKNYAAISPWLKWVGVIYMAWLAISLFLRFPKKKSEPGALRDGYVAGIFLQFVNPKGILYGITIYTSFSSLLAGSLGRTLGSAALLSAIVFAAVSTWCLVGSALSRLFDEPAFRLAFNIVMALLLVYSAVSIVLH
ncbi:MAG: LysE family transporter [Rectinemataceae bacterium]|jgi:cysteine/O-acetylserine efflux protein